MSGFAFMLRGLWFFRRSYLGVLGGSVLGAMVLLGAMMAGDSVQQTLRQVATARLGKVNTVLAGGDRFFRSALADDLPSLNATSAGALASAGASRHPADGLPPLNATSAGALASAGASSHPADGLPPLNATSAAPVLIVKASATAQRSGRALGNVQVLGVDPRFWQLGPDDSNGNTPQARGFFVNEHLARSLDLESNETLVLRFDKPGSIARDAPLAGKAAELIALSGEIGDICGDAQFGRFSLETTQLPQATVFVPLERLQQALGLAGKANLLLIKTHQGANHAKLLDEITRNCTLEDYGLTIEDVPLANAVEIRSSRIFFDRKVAAAIQHRFPSAQPVITYMANSIVVNGKSIPYSMVTAVDAAAAPFLPDKPSGAVLNAWAADDLAANPGDEVSLTYFALDGTNRLVERSTRMTLAGVVPLTGLAADPRWMPEFPGVASAEKTADWDAGVPIDLKRIRDKDEAYWNTHRGTPKLFMPLQSGRELFGNRWGEFTALRLPVAVASRDEVVAGLLDILTPSVAGLTLQDVGSQANAAAGSPVEFAGLLLGMSLFLIAAAVVLTAMMFRFHIEQRNRESGLLVALGISPNKILRWHLLEGLCVVVAGSGIGALLAVGYTRFLLGILETIWGGVGGQHWLRFHVEASTLAGGMTGFVGLMLLAIWLVTRKQAGQNAGMRLEAGSEEVRRKNPRRLPWWALGYAALGMAALTSSGLLGAAGGFFLAGCMFMLAGLALYEWVLQRRVVVANAAGLTTRRLAELNCARRATRSLVVVGSLASGVFLVVAVAAFRKHDDEAWQLRESGAGGFAWWVETTRAMNRNNANPAADDVLDLGPARALFGRVLPLRIGPGDDASCFNLNSVARPRLLATDVSALATLGAFPIKQVLPGYAKSWDCLRAGPVLRAFVDETTLLWVLKKKLGEQIIYQDEWGHEFPVELAGVLDGSVFQGCLVVDEAGLLLHYPSAEGPRLFLLESASTAAATDRAKLQQALADEGAMVTSTRERLAGFNGVENTYLAIFHLLGGLGVLVGSAGLGLLTASNLQARRYEFAILHTLGVPALVTRRVVLSEVAQFIRWGLGIGMLAALVAILPTLSTGSMLKSLGWIGVLVAAIAANAWGWSWLGYRRQLRHVLGAAREFR
ncbi:MAG: FtsX-like permease family protein [Verrucomicrobiota bacterium]